MKRAFFSLSAILTCLFLCLVLHGCGTDPAAAPTTTPVTPNTSVHIHDWEAATCTTPKTCLTCGETEGSAAGHDWKAATCTKPKTCLTCGETEGSAAGHDWKAATCTKPKTCLTCGETEGSAAGHDWKAATCTKPKTCLTCGETEGSATGHDWKAATCTKPKTCLTCSETEGSAAGHDWKAATCTKPKTCLTCSETEGSAAGHDWKAATCTKPKTCLTCGETEGSATGHDWKAATCTKPKTCLTCGETEGTKLNHTYEEVVTKQPGCDTTGIKTFTCTACGDSYTEEISAITYTATQIYTLFENSLGEIITYNQKGEEIALGTCFVYSTDGKLITNYHVIDGAYSAKVTINGKTYDIQYVLAYDKKIDLAVLQINANNLIPMSICEKNHATGSTVFAFGSSRGLTYTLSQGIITHADRNIDGVRYVQHDAAISGGNSGGPLINQYGEIIGINTMTIKDSQNLNFAINIAELHNLQYGKQLSMSEFYAKECNPYLKLKNYITENGTYFSDSNCYGVLLGISYSSDGTIKYSRYAYYYVSDGDITLDLIINDGVYWLYMIIDEDIDGIYSWEYFDDSDFKMGGIIYANTYTDDTLLDYSHNNISYASLRSSIRKLASSMMALLAISINNDCSSLGITAQDLGFLYF